VSGVNDDKTVYANGNYENFLGEFERVFGDVRRTMNNGAICPSCNTNYLVPENKKRLFYTDENFATGFHSKEDEKENNIFYWKVCPKVASLVENIKGTELSAQGLKDEKIEFELSYKQIRIDKEAKQIFYKSFEDDEFIEVKLKDVSETVEAFFKTDIKIIFGFHHLHMFVNNLSDIVSDSSSIDIIGGLLQEINNASGIDEISKIMIIFFSIIRYSNLSTIALTKSPIFLFDLIRECELPDEQIMKDSKITKPIRIFNFLTKTYVDKLNDYIDADNRDVHDFVYKSKTLMETVETVKTIQVEKNVMETYTDEDGKSQKRVVMEKKTRIDEETGKEVEYEIPKTEFVEKKITTEELVVQEGTEEKELILKVRNQKEIDKASKNTRLKIVHKGMQKENDKGEGITVMDIIEDGSISKSIYKSLRNFSDYKSILKYFKFYDKHEVINILNKYEIDVLKHLIDENTGIYFREKMDLRELDQVISLTTSFARQKTLGRYRLEEGSDLLKTDEEIETNYELIRSFDWNFYDDALLMLEEFNQMLAEKPDQAKHYDRNKYFNKIKDFDKLRKYHDNLVTRYAFIKQEYGGESPFTKFTTKFKYLEESSEYTGNIKVIILDNVQDFIAEGEEMSHSAGNYGNKVSSGFYLVAKLIDESPRIPKGEMSRFTIGFNYNAYTGLEFHQLKSYHNQLASDRVRVLVMDWMTQNDISYMPLNDIKLNGDGTTDNLDISVNESVDKSEDWKGFEGE
tara:strand:+ start:30927 stop:33155 length:2229 start_codon:yes stop_codon:yes gene_type:complete